MKKTIFITLFIAFCHCVPAQSTAYEYIWIQKGHALKNQVSVVSATEVKVIPVEVQKGQDTSGEMVKKTLDLVQEYEQQGWELYQATVTGATVSVFIMRRARTQ